MTRTAKPASVSADEFSACCLPDGSLQEITGAGNVHAVTRRTTGEDHLEADHAELRWPGAPTSPRRLTATGSVTASATAREACARSLASSTLQVDFAADGKQGQARVVRATTPAGALDWEGPSQAAGREVTQRVHMTSQHWEATFGGENQLEELRGSGDAQFERRMGDAPPETGSSRDLLARFGPAGDWSTVDQTGDVALREPDRNARADAAHYDRLADTVALSGSVELSDSDSITTAQSATLHRSRKRISAQGSRGDDRNRFQHERPRDFAPGSGTHLGRPPRRQHRYRPCRLLRAMRASGKAIRSSKRRPSSWTGHARAHCERPSARHFPAGPVAAPQRPISARPASCPPTKPPVRKNEFWHAEAERMTYASDEGRAHLEKNVVAHSEQGSIHSDAMDLFFCAAGIRAAGTSPGASRRRAPCERCRSRSSAAGTGRQLVRAAGLGNVEVTPGGPPRHLLARRLHRRGRQIRALRRFPDRT